MHFCKFEELRDHPQSLITEVFQFLLNVRDLSGTYVK